MKRLLILLAILLHGCATVEKVSESTDTFAICKSADVLTTAAGLNSGKFVESNPVLKPFIGPHHIFPLIAFSLLMWTALDHFNEPKLTQGANAVTCGVAAHNLWIMK